MFQINSEGQLFKIIQEEKNNQEGQVIETQMEQGNEIQQDIQIAPPIYQEINQAQMIQNMEYQNMQGYSQNQQRKMALLNIPKRMNSPLNKYNNIQSPSPRIKEINLKKKTEPRDSNPKIYITSNRSNNKFRMRQNESSPKNLKTNMSQSTDKFYNFEMNYTDRGISKSKISQKVQLNKLNFESLKEAQFVDIPRNEYHYYTDRPTLVINDGMKTGEYKFIGAKTILKEATFPRKAIINEGEIMQEIYRRNKARKEKKVTYEIIDKFYTLTEIRGKTVKRLEKKVVENNKTKFYGAMESHNNNNFNTKMNISGSNYENNNIMGQSNISKGVNYGSYFESSKFKSGGSINAKGFSGNYKSGGSGKGSSNYYEFKTQIPIENKLNFNTNISSMNSIASLPADNYSKYLLEQINRIRIDPQSFIGVIEDAKANIGKDKFGRLIYKGKMKIALAKGESAFNEAIEYLKNIESMGVLKYNSYLTVMPPQNVEEIKDKDDLGRKVMEMINGGMNIKSYWRDVIKDPEISFLLMIIDDNGSKSGMRRKDILNPNMEYIGISSVEINKNFVCYITLS